MSHILVISSRFYEGIADQLVSSASQVIEQSGVRYDVVEVPGVFELPGAVAMAQQRYDGFVALGCVIRGETSHYELVCAESARGLMELSIKEQCAIGYGIITVESMDQALHRASPDGKDVGGRAAQACLSMMDFTNRLSV